MGGSDKQSKKRKKKNSEDTTDNEQLLDKSASDSLPISEVIGQAERVLYDMGTATSSKHLPQ